MIPSAFERLMVVHTGSQIERGFLAYVASIASLAPDASVQLLVTPADDVLRTFTPVARSLFAERGIFNLQLRALTEGDLDEVFAAARHRESDLLVMRHPRTMADGCAVARRLFTRAPCSVCVVPDEAPPRIERVVAGVTLAEEGVALVECAARLCRQAGADELIAVHSAVRETLACDEDLAARLREQQLLDMTRFLARARLHGVPCTPVIDEEARYHYATLRAARTRQADLVVIGRSAEPASPLHGIGRGAEELLWTSDVPLLQVRLREPRIRLRDLIAKRFLTRSEPAFN